MHQNKLLSVLVPAYNAEKYIADCLRGLLRQTYPFIEILFCDDASSDKTFETASQFQDHRITRYRNASNMGKNKTCLYLLERAKGEYISVHDADDISVPNRFEQQMSFLLKNPEYAMCGTNYISFLQNGKIIDRSNLETDYNRIRKLILEESQFHGPTVVFKKDVIPLVGGFYRYFPRGEDIDFTMRVAEKFRVTNLPAHLYLYRHVATSLTNNVHGYSIERWGHAKLLYHLSNERRENNGIDSLMRGDIEAVDLMMDRFTAEYKKDPTIAFRKGAFRLVGMRMYKNAIMLSWRALLQDVTMLNIKCVLYSILASIKGYWELLRRREKIDKIFLGG